MKDFGYIYKTTCLVNGMLYIGKRKGDFTKDYFGSGIALCNSINKHGKDNFIVKALIYGTSNDELNFLEKQYIKGYRDRLGRKSLYNIADGGEGGPLVQMFGKDNPMYKFRGEANPRWIERESRQCLICSTFFEVRITDKRKFCSNKCSLTGRVWMYNEDLDKGSLVSKQLADEYLKNGWELGRGKKVSKAISLAKQGEKNPMFGNGHLISGEKHYMFGKPGFFTGKKHTEESNQKNREKHLGKTAWNKGLTAKTDPRVAKYIKASAETRKKNKELKQK